MTNEDYIKYEIQQGIQKWQISDLYQEVKEIDKEIDHKFDKLDHKINWLYGVVITVAILPKILHYLGWT